MNDDMINGKQVFRIVCQSCGWSGKRRSAYQKPCPKCWRNVNAIPLSSAKPVSPPIRDAES